MFRYRLHSPDGDDLGEAAYAMQIHADVPDSKTEAERLERRLCGETGTKNRYQDDESEPVEVV
jgi:hypothetical protein